LKKIKEHKLVPSRKNDNINTNEYITIRSEHGKIGTMKNDIQLYNLIPTDSPEALLDDVLKILKLISPDFDTDPVETAFNAVADLYRGDWPGYKACNTTYHDLSHTTGAFIAMAQLIHGAVVDGNVFTDRHVTLGLITALLHDVGYIQEEHDAEGTGAKYTKDHVQRSMDFLKRHGSELGLSEKEITDGRAMIQCTEFTIDINTVEFTAGKVKLLAKILASADLLAQMADRIYLEKLLFLYYEFREGGVSDYESELDFLQKTVKFYDLVAQHFKTTLDDTDMFMSSHFVSRWGIQANLYHVAIERQRNYLCTILELPNSDPLDHLKRHGIVDKVRREYQGERV